MRWGTLEVFIIIIIIIIIIMMNHHTKFENKMFDGLEDIIRTNINILTRCCDRDPECCNLIFFIGHSGF